MTGTIVAAGAAAGGLLAMAASQPWFQERCAQAGLSAEAAAALVGGVALLAGAVAARQRKSGGRPFTRVELAECDSCGQPLMADWRMCPY
ncbi:MAG: hypothetical protein N3B11_06675, partial [Coriobacteriia bacterium]|nr:hypothetical protein [Coriobacteriia bacterium]